MRKLLLNASLLLSIVLILNGCGGQTSPSSDNLTSNLDNPAVLQDIAVSELVQPKLNIETSVGESTSFAPSVPSGKIVSSHDPDRHRRPERICLQVKR